MSIRNKCIAAGVALGGIAALTPPVIVGFKDKNPGEALEVFIMEAVALVLVRIGRDAYTEYRSRPRSSPHDTCDLN